MKAILKKFLAVFLAAAMLFGAGQSLALGISASAAGADGTLSIATRFFRQVEATEEWVETERVAKGENVKARAYIGTDYYTNSGELMFFYDADFFTDTYVRDTINQCTVNPVYADLYGLEAQAVVCSNDSRIVQRILEYGLVTEEFINEHVCIAVLYMFATDTANMMLEIDEWLVEFDLTVLESDLAQSGDFFALDTTVQSTSNPYGYINVPWGNAGEFAEHTIILADKDVAVDIQSTPVYSYSNLTFDASGGYFADTGYTDRYEATGNIREDFYLGDVPIPEREGYVFVGWSYDGTLEALVESIVTVDYEDMHFVAVWEAAESMISFDTRCEIYIDPIVAPYDSEVYLPEPARVGYTFGGWIDENGERVYGNYVMPYYDVVLTAEWYVNLYDIYFHANGGEFIDGSEVLTDEYAYGNEIAFPEEPTREGHDFRGWVFEDGTAAEIDKMPDRELTVIAEWETETYTLVFEDTGDVAVPYITVAYGDTFPVIEMPVRMGYTFVGWDVELPDIIPDFGENGAEVVYTALWVPDEGTPYEIIHYMMLTDGTYEQMQFETRYGTTGEEINYIPPEIEGFTLNADMSVLNAVVQPDGTTVLMAYYDRNAYNLSLYVDGNVTLEQYLYGEAIEYIEEPVKHGYRFECWINIATGEAVEFPLIMPIDGIELEVVWSPDEYKVRFDAAGGKFDDGREAIADVFEVGSAVAEPVPPAREGYIFIGWDPYIPDEMPAEDLSFTAVWEAAEYTIEFNTNGGEELEPVTVRYGEEYVLPTAVKTGCIFVGWRDADNNMYTAGYKLTVPAYDMELRAVWMVQSRRVTFVIGEDSVSFDVVAGQAIPMPDMSSYENIEVICWLDSNGKETEIPDIMPDNSLTFTARVKYSCGGNKYGVTASYESGCFDHEGDDIRFVVEEVTGRREPGGVYFKGENYKQISLYNIKFYYGDVQIQPKNGKVEICIPVPEAYKNSTHFLVIHRFSEGGYEELSAAKKNGKLVFLTGSFSDFEIYVKSETAIKTKPSKLSYNYKEALDLSGLTLEAVDENGNKTVVSDTSKMTVKGYDSKKIGTQTLTVEYDGTSVQFNVTVSYAWWQMLIRILLLGFLWY